MRHVFLALALIGASAAATTFASPIALAGILCKDGFQNSGGNWISTPYCNDAELARVARKHGVRVIPPRSRASCFAKGRLKPNSPPRSKEFCGAGGCRQGSKSS